MDGLNHEWKREFESIPLPSELRQRSLMGIQRAQEELNQSIGASCKKPTIKLSRKSIFTSIAVGLLVIILTISAFQPQVIAGIQRILQFVPGIGIVKQEEQEINRYVLKQPVNMQLGLGEIMVTGVMVDQEMTYLTMTGNRFFQKPNEIVLVNNKGAEFVIKHSTSVGSVNQWSAGYWYQGKLDIEDGPAKIIIREPNQFEIPFTLMKAEKFGSYEEMGETAALNDISITAIASRNGSKGRLSLISQQAGNIRVIDYGVHGIHNGRTLSLKDADGKLLEIEKIPGVGGPVRDFYFKLNPDQTNETYTLHIPEINVEYEDKVAVKVPTKTEDNLNKTFTIVGFPVTITRTERLSDNILRVYLDLHFNPNTEKSLHMLGFELKSYHGKLNDQTGALEYVEFDIPSGFKEKKLTIVKPEVLIRGPWIFQFLADKYFKP